MKGNPTQCLYKSSFAKASEFKQFKMSEISTFGVSVVFLIMRTKLLTYMKEPEIFLASYLFFKCYNGPIVNDFKKKQYTSYVVISLYLTSNNSS